MSKFKIGDIIKQEGLCNYGVTNKRYGWVGEVIGIIDNYKIRVKTVSIEESRFSVGKVYSVKSEYFVLKRDLTPAEKFWNRVVHEKY